MKRIFGLVLAGGVGAAAVGAVRASVPGPSVAGDSRCFELRTYTTAAGKLEALHTRFRDHTRRIFGRHGMTMIGFWVPRDAEKGADNTLVYMLAYPDCAARDKAWDAFRSDPEWMAVREASEANGKVVERVDSLMLSATDYSPVR